jgi:exodeoxyribonuclease-3
MNHRSRTLDLEPDRPRTVKLVTWNVNGIRARHAELQDLLAAEQPDVVCLQEIKASPEQIPALLLAAAEHWCCWHGAGGYSGVAILVRHTHVTKQPAFTHPYFDMEQRIVVADLGAVQVASVYVPNGGKDFPAKLRFLEAVTGWAAQANRPERPLVLCGDLNVAREERDVHPKERKPNQVGTRPDERALFARFVDVAGLVDVGRALDPDNDELFTWWAPWRNLRQRNIGWRIDYVLTGTPLAARAAHAVSRRDFGTSDHAPLVVTFADAVS